MQPASAQSDRDIRALADSLLRNWRLFIISVALGVSAAWVVTRYTNPVYAVKGSILIAAKGGDPAAMLFGENLFGRSEEVANQTVISRSLPMITAAIDSLPLKTAIFRDGTLRDIELYKAAPFVVKQLSPTRDQTFDIDFKLSPLQGGQFKLLAKDRRRKLQLLSAVYKYGEAITTGNGFVFTVEEKSNEELGVYPIGETYRFYFHNPLDLAFAYHERLKVALEDEESSILNITLEGSTPAKEIDIINALMNQLMLASLSQKNQVATNTVAFLERELRGIKDSLNLIEYRLQEFKSGKALMNVDVETQSVYRQLQGINDEKARLDLQLKYYAYLQNFFARKDNLDKLVSPSAFGLSDPYLNKLTEDLVGLQLEKNGLRRDGRDKNPAIAQLIAQIEDKQAALQATLRNNLEKFESTNRIAQTDINRRLADAERRARQLPRSERTLINIQRIYNLSERLYLLMMEKKAEAEISRSSNTADLRIIEPARLVKLTPKSPKKLLNLLIGLAAGLILPVVYVLLRDLFSTRVNRREHLNGLNTLPFLGEVPNSKKSTIQHLVDNPRSALAEAMRNIRTNMSFMLPGGGSKTILFTSSIPGEGKSFSSLHLGVMLAQSGKKVVIIDADMRRPRLHVHLGMKAGQGLSHFLIGQTSLEEMLMHTHVPGLDVIFAGSLPPNPGDLLLALAMQQLHQTLQQTYDYVLIDTAPALVVSDAASLLPLADLAILVIRSQYTRKDSIERLSEFVEKHAQTHFAVMLNDVRQQQAVYYTYYTDKQPGFFSRLVGRFRS